MVELMLVVPENVTPEIAAFAGELSPGATPTPIPVCPHSGAIELRCWQNVTMVSEQHGGQPVKGWRLWWIPDILIEAQAHVVWQMPGGHLIDVTPNEDDEQTCLFVRDESMSPNPGIDYVPSRFKNLCGAPVVDEYIRCASAVAEHSDKQKTSSLWIPDPPEKQRLSELLQEIKVLVRERGRKS